MSSLMRTPMRTESTRGDGGRPCSTWAFPVMTIGAQPPLSTPRATAMITKKPNFLTFSPVLLEVPVQLSYISGFSGGKFRREAVHSRKTCRRLERAHKLQERRQEIFRRLPG